MVMGGGPPGGGGPGGDDPAKLQELIDRQAEYLDKLLETKKVLGEISDSYDHAEAKANAELATRKEMYRVLSMGNKAREDEVEYIDKRLASGKAFTAEERKIMEERREYLNSIGPAEIEQEKKKLAIKIKQGVKEEENQKRAERGIAKWAALIGMGQKASETMLGTTFELVGAWKSGGKALKKMWKEGMFGGFYLSILEDVMMGHENLSAGFVKSTGATEGMTDAVQSAGNDLMAMGMGFETAYTAAQSLIGATTMFRTGTAAAQKELAKFVGLLERAGISATEAAQSLEVFNKVLGMNRIQSQAALESMIHFAQTLGVSVNQVLRDFGQTMPVLSAHGSNATKVFKELQIIANQTGVAMSNLMGVAGQYDTFEGAASSVAKLNAALGGSYLSSVDMVYASESQRLEMLHESLRVSGKSFDSLGRYEKRMLATASGFQDVGEASKFFNTSLEVQAAKSAEAAKKQEKMEELARRSTDIMQELRMTFQQLAVDLKPVIDFFSAIVKQLSEFLGAMGGAPAKVLAFVYAGYRIIGMLKLLKIQAVSTAVATAFSSPWLLPGMVLAGAAAAAWLGSSGSGATATAAEESDEPTFHVGKPMTSGRGARGGRLRPGEIYDGKTSVHVGGVGTAVYTQQATTSLIQGVQDMVNATNNMKVAIENMNTGKQTIQMTLDDKIVGEVQMGNFNRAVSTNRGQ